MCLFVLVCLWSTCDKYPMFVRLPFRMALLYLPGELYMGLWGWWLCVFGPFACSIIFILVVFVFLYLSLSFSLAGSSLGLVLLLCALHFCKAYAWLKQIVHCSLPIFFYALLSLSVCFVATFSGHSILVDVHFDYI